MIHIFTYAHIYTLKLYTLIENKRPRKIHNKLLMCLTLKNDSESVFYIALFLLSLFNFVVVVMRFKTKIPKHVSFFYSCSSALPYSRSFLLKGMKVSSFRDYNYNQHAY